MKNLKIQIYQLIYPTMPPEKPQLPQQSQQQPQSPEKRDMLTSLKELHQEKIKPSDVALRETIEARRKNILDFLDAAPSRADRFEREKALDKAVQQLIKEYKGLNEVTVYKWIYGDRLNHFLDRTDIVKLGNFNARSLIVPEFIAIKDSIPMFIFYKILKNGVFNSLDFFKAISKEPYAEEILLMAAEKDPNTFLGTPDLFIHESYGKRALKKIVDTLLQQKKYGVLLYRAKSYINEPYGRDVLTTAISSGLDMHPAEVLAAAPYFSREPYAADVIEKAARKLVGYNTEYQIQFLISHVKSFKSAPYAEELMAKAVAIGPQFVLDGAKLFFDEPWASSIIQHAVYRLLEKNDTLAILRSLDVIAREPYFYQVLEKVIDISPADAISNANHYDTKSYWPAELVEKAIKKAEKDCLDQLIRNCHVFLDKPYAGDILLRGAEEFPYITLEWGFHYKNKPYTDTVIQEAAARDPIAVLEFADRFVDKPYAGALIERAVRTLAKEKPDELLRRADLIAKYRFQPSSGFNLQHIIQDAMVDDPISAMGNRDNLRDFHASSDRPEIKKLGEIMSSYNNFEHFPMVFFDDIVNGKMTYQEARELYLHQKDIAMNRMITLINKPGVLGRTSLDNTLRSLTLESVRTINDLHELPPEKRFESVKNMDSLALYTVMVYGEEELFTSSFNGLFNRLIEKMKAEKRTGRDLLDGVGKNKFRTFIKLCSRFNRLNEFLDTFQAEDRKMVVQEFVRNIEGAKDKLSEAVTVADTFASINDAQLLHLIQTTVKGEYERTQKEKSVDGTKLYGLLAGMFGERAVIDETWYAQMAAKYKLDDTTHLDTKELYNPDGSNVQEYFFYDDADGKASFESFLRQYRGQPEWKIQDFKTYILISGAKNGKKVLMYANKPEHAGAGNEDIEKALEAAKIETIVIVHRGHSYHVDNTIKKITPRARIVALGSCGGYVSITKVLEKSPRAHILSTKGTGTMLVNDPVYKMLNEEILLGKRIDWPAFWEKMRGKIGNNRDFDDYVAPHKNLGVIFLKAYRGLRG